MAGSCSSSSDTSSSKYEFSASDSDHKRRGFRNHPRRLPTSNNKNAVAARINRMKQKQYVKDLEHKISRVKSEIKSLKREYKKREQEWASSLRQVAYLRRMISNSHQIGGLLRNLRWRNIETQEERDTDYSNMVPPPPVAPQEDEGRALLDGVNPATTELFQETVPSKYVSVCTLLP